MTIFWSSKIKEAYEWLNDLHQADVSIAMEPMHTRAQTKGRLALGGRQPPLAIGASLVSLPCGLFMQYETSLYALTQLTREARRLLNAVRMVSRIQNFRRQWE